MDWIGFPGLFKWLALIGVAVTVMGWLSPGIAEMITFDRERILQGEVWRVFSFALAPVGMFPPGVLGVLFLVFGVMIAFLISDSLEEVWGVTRTTLYLVVGWLGLVLGQFATAPPPMLSGVYLYTSMFFAFATYFPRYEFRLFMILPIQVRFLAWFAFAMLMLNCLADPRMFGILAGVLIPYGLWVLPAHLRERSAIAQSARRREKFVGSQESEDDAFHRCCVCERTEKSNPELDFRSMMDGTEYCVDHLPKSESGE